MTIVKYVLLTLIAISGAALAQDAIRVDVTLVNVFATVQDNDGKFVTGLNRNDFRLYEDDIPQEIQVFESEDKVQSSVAMLVDTSGSMIDVLPLMKKGIRDFTKSQRRTDEFSVISIGASPRLLHKSTQGERHLEESLDRLRADGISLLFDGILYGSGEIGKSERPRKALIIFTDAILTDDKKTISPYTRVVEEVQRSSVLLYFIVIGPPILVDSHTVESLSNISGGRTIYAAKNDSIPSALDEVRLELSKQYYLGYYASRKPGFHRIRVDVPGRDVKIRAKSGYLGG